MAVTITNLFGEQEELVVQTNNSKFILDKINNPLKAINEPTVKKLKSNKYTLQEKIEIVRQAVIEILGVYISNTRVIKTREELHEIIDIANKQKEIAIDTETNNSLDPITCKIMGLCLFVENQKNIYVPINHVNVDTKERLSWQLNEQDIKEELNRLNSDVKFIMHNGKFDYQVLKCTCNGKYLPYWDTLIAARLLDENEKAGLKEQYIDKIDPSIEKYSIEKLFGEIPYEYFDPELFALYAATDAFMTYKLYKYQQKEFAKAENAKLYNLFMEVEMPIVEVTAEMELRGTTIDREYSNLLGKKYELKMETLVRDITNELKKYEQDVLEWRKTPEANFRKKKEKKTKNGEYEKSKNEQLETPMNISSPIQLSIFLYDVLKCPSVDKKSPRGTGGEILETLKERRPDLSKLINLLLDYKTTEKLKSTFVDKLPTYINVDGRIHAGFNSMGTNCIKGSSIVLTSNGYYPIKELFNGNEIDGEYYEDSTKILNKDLQVEETSHRIKFSSAKTRTITLRGGYSITGTYHHPIICSSITREDIARNRNNKHRVSDNLGFKKLEDIKVGDIVAIPYGYNIFPQEYLELNCEVTKLVTHKREDIKFPKYCNEEFAELLGMYHADGSIHTSNGSYTIRIANHDKDVDNRVKYLVKNLFNIDTKYIIDSTYISATSIREISKFLTVGARNKQIPSIIMQSPKSVMCAYIRGMSLDSTYDKNRKRIKFTIANEESAYCVQSVLLNLGIISHLGKTLYKNEYNHMREKVDNHVGYRLEISGEYYDKYVEEIGVIQSRKLDRIPFKSKEMSYLVDDKYYYAYVKEIEDGINDVFDFTIPKTHSFIANGIINHNTGRYSSKNPNLQQIPSHEQSIRMLFVPRTEYKEVLSKDNYIKLKSFEEMQLSNNTWVLIKDLKIGDRLLSEDGTSVKIIDIQDIGGYRRILLDDYCNKDRGGW